MTKLLKNDLRSGQGCVEYALMLAVFALIILVVASVLEDVVSDLFGNNSEQESTTDNFVDSSMDEVFGLTPIVFGEINIIGNELEAIVDVNVQNLNNCTGSEPLVINRQFTQQVERRVETFGSGTVTLTPAILRAELFAHLNIREGERISESTGVEMRAAPGTSVNYEITWIKVSTIGTIEVTQGARTDTITFAIPSSLRVEVNSRNQDDC